MADLALREPSNEDGETLEYRILAVLARHQEGVVTNRTLLREVWGPSRDDSGSLRVYIGNLRRKLEDHPSHPRHIITEFGLGYRLLLGDEASP